MTKMRCRNWKGSGKVSYQDVASLESHFDKGEVFAFISSTGNLDVVESTDFVREDEKKDERVGRILDLINAKHDWKQFAWEVEALPAHMELSDSEEVQGKDVSATHVEEPAVVAEEAAAVPKMGKRKLTDPGAESRKKQLLCERAAEHNSGVSGEMKTFIEDLFTSSFNAFKELVQKDFNQQFEKVTNEVGQLKEQVSQLMGPSHTVGKGNASEILCPSATLGKDQANTSHTPGPSAAKGKGKAAATATPTPVRRSSRQDENELSEFLRNLTKPSTYVDKGTQESLQDAMGNLSQASHVKSFDASQQLNGEEPGEWATPLSSFKPADWRPPTLKDVESHEDRMHDPDYSLRTKIGPSMLTSELVARVMGPTEWLKNHEIDAIMWLFTERTSLRRWLPNNVAFMTCLFSNQVKNSFLELKKDIQKFKVSELLQQYGIGELPAHGRTRLMWDLDVDRMYVPLNVGNHWISMCVNFATRSIEVFDCEGLKHKSAVEPFAVLIPRIVKAVQSSNSRQLNVRKYTITYASMPFLNKSSSDCGVYALKHIECHLLGLDFSVVNDENIREARHKIAYDLWEAANDPVLISRMAKFTPSKTFTNPLVELE
ncbi:hypothetical protein Rs2_38634 [Raphanus sativus]|nr:hypothetical protein Rs2_38634 [Raphanus sativus]